MRVFYCQPPRKQQITEPVALPVKIIIKTPSNFNVNPLSSYISKIEFMHANKITWIACSIVNEEYQGHKKMIAST